LDNSCKDEDEYCFSYVVADEEGRVVSFTYEHPAYQSIVMKVTYGSSPSLSDFALYDSTCTKNYSAPTVRPECPTYGSTSSRVFAKMTFNILFLVSCFILVVPPFFK